MARHEPKLAAADASLLTALGGRIRACREARGMTRGQLALLCGLSTRFLAQVETGRGNIAVTRLARIAGDLGEDVAALVGPGRLSRNGRHLPVIALVGLRGAGKSSLGSSAASRLDIPFLEHDRLVEEAEGMGLGEIFSLHGDAYYRAAARRVLLAFLRGAHGPAVLATSGGIVADGEAFEPLLERCHTVWLKARAEDHWRRVAAQGDRRPMKDHPDSMAALRRLLKERGSIYARAEHHVDTSTQGFAATATRLTRLLRGLVLQPGGS